MAFMSIARYLLDGFLETVEAITSQIMLIKIRNTKYEILFLSMKMFSVYAYAAIYSLLPNEHFCMQ